MPGLNTANANPPGSLTRFGQQKPIVVNSNNVILAGNGTWQAAKELGWDDIQIVRTGLAGSAATAFAIADNRTSETSEWDHQALADTLAALSAEDADLAGAAGYSPDELATMFGSEPEAEPATPPDDFPAFDESIPTDHECPKCKYRWSGSAAAQGAAK